MEEKSLQEEIIIKLPIFLKVLGISSLLLSIFILIEAVLNKSNLIELITVILFFGLSGLWILLGVFNMKLIVNDNQLKHTNMFSKETTFKWSEIETIKFGKVSKELNIKTKNQSIKVHRNTTNFWKLIEKIEENTNITREILGLK